LTKDPIEKFEIAAVPKSTPNGLTLEICTSLIDDGKTPSTGMTLVEVYLPSGYIYDPQTADNVMAKGVRVRGILSFHKHSLVEPSMYFRESKLKNKRQWSFCTSMR
jgi:hypothetical protein